MSSASLCLPAWSPVPYPSLPLCVHFALAAPIPLLSNLLNDEFLPLAADNLPVSVPHLHTDHTAWRAHTYTHPITISHALRDRLSGVKPSSQGTAGSAVALPRHFGWVLACLHNSADAEHLVRVQNHTLDCRRVETNALQGPHCGMPAPTLLCCSPFLGSCRMSTPCLGFKVLLGTT